MYWVVFYFIFTYMYTHIYICEYICISSPVITDCVTLQHQPSDCKCRNLNCIFLINYLKQQLYCATCQMPVERFIDAFGFRHADERGGDNVCTDGILCIVAGWLVPTVITCHRVQLSARNQINVQSPTIKYGALKVELHFLERGIKWNQQFSATHTTLPLKEGSKY